MNADRSNIEAAKERLPLPELIRALGFTPPGGAEGGNMQSPFSKGRKQKTPSFSIFRKGESWGWCDRSGGEERKGDEITFLETLEGLSRADALRRYLALAGVETARPAAAGRKGGAKAKTPIAHVRHGNPAAKVNTTAASGDAFNWPAAVEKFGPKHIERLCKWRGYSPAFVEWLKSQSLVGATRDGIAFPVHNDAGEVVSAHVRPKSTKWFFTPRGHGVHPLIIGDIKAAEKVMVFESQWDAFAVMDVARWHEGPPVGWAVLVTRGSSNGKYAALAAGAVYAWPQNDEEKEGKRAGEEWFAAVLAAARGPVYRVSTPPEFADANDWTRARPVDAWYAIECAEIAEKPAKAPVPAKGSEEPPAQPPRPPFDPEKTLADIDLYWLNGSPSYFLRQNDRGRERFLEMGASEVRRKLRVRGLRVKPDPEAGECVSQVDSVLDAATETRAVDFALSIAGTRAGVYDLPGGRVLVRESPCLVEPVKGDFTNILDFLEALLGEEAHRFCYWLKIAYETLRKGDRRPGQAVIIVGPPDCGKSRIQHQIITPIFAGRSADPKSFFFGGTDFNAELVGAEHLLMEEVSSSAKQEERLVFGERIKEVVANDTARLHKKNRDAVTVSPFRRLSITLNDDPEKLRCLPPLSEDFTEKIIMLKARHAPKFWERFADAEDPRKAFRETFARELPAFAYWLLKTPIPEKLQSRRYGVQSYIPEELQIIIHEGEPQHHLMLLIDKGLFPGDEKPSPWQGDAEDLKQALCEEGCPSRFSAQRLIGAVQLNTIGIWLRRLHEKFPSRVISQRTADKRNWIIHPPRPA